MILIAYLIRLIKSNVLDLIANVEKINENYLKLKWKSLNNFGYAISLYRISLSINESTFQELDDAHESLLTHNQISK